MTHYRQVSTIPRYAQQYPTSSIQQEFEQYQLTESGNIAQKHSKMKTVFSCCYIPVIISERSCKRAELKGDAYATLFVSLYICYKRDIVINENSYIRNSMSSSSSLCL